MAGWQTLIGEGDEKLEDVMAEEGEKEE